jgi:hypothetical protein
MLSAPSPFFPLPHSHFHLPNSHFLIPTSEFALPSHLPTFFFIPPSASCRDIVQLYRTTAGPTSEFSPLQFLSSDPPTFSPSHLLFFRPSAFAPPSVLPARYLNTVLFVISWYFNDFASIPNHSFFLTSTHKNKKIKTISHAMLYRYSTNELRPKSNPTTTASL